jgi:hypothetical protein
MKEILEAIESRVRSPFLGYFSFSFVAINWKPIFYLFTSSTDVLERFSYFETNTSFVTLLVHPLIISAVFALSYPWISLIFIFASIKPIELKNGVQAESESKLLAKKKRLEFARSELLSAEEAELIDRAKRDVELNKIEDDDVRKKLKEEIEGLRNERDNLRGRDSPSESELEQVAKSALSNRADGQFQLSDLYTKDTWATLDNALKHKLGKQFKKKVDSDDYLGIVFTGRGTGNQAIYRKSSANRLTDAQEKTLRFFVGLPDGEGHTASDLANKTRLYLDKVRHIIDQLVSNNHLVGAGITLDEEKLFELTSTGREYLINHNLLDNQST